MLKYKRSDFDLDISLILIRLRPDNTSAVKDVLIGVSVAQSALIDYAPQMIMMMGGGEDLLTSVAQRNPSSNGKE